ncbi:hypothetical protein TSAR_001081 [Trichomalopsis sarcophagae]|uniref:Odorant receptor n=1 Tax=Trichomalopsis sarcophagae TaxID=543379 RepID=A0A232FCN3_9HYME|nr:hypothetical protein TSAR_001081 [Trichomalopsis sarcophagae]
MSRVLQSGSSSREGKRVWSKDAKFALMLNKFIVWPLGLWPLECDDAFSRFRNLYAVVSQVWMIGTQATAAYLGCGDVADTVDFVMMTACALMALSKIVTIRLHMSKVHMVFVSALDDWLDVDKSRDVLIPFAKTGRFVFYLQIVSAYMSNTLIIVGALPFLVPPAANGTWANVSETLQSRQLPTRTGCMFAGYRDEIYGSLYVYESVMIMITAHGNVGCDVLFFILAMHLCGQIELLKTDVLKIGEDEKVPGEWKNKIVECVHRHIRLLGMAKALNKVVSGVLVIQLLLNAGLNLMLGIRMLIEIKRGSIFNALRPMIGFNVLMLQLYLLSYASDRLSSQAESILDAVYDSYWYKLPAKLRRDLYFVTMRANKPIYFMAGHFYAMNIENFMNILKASFSYFSILRIMFQA